MAGRLIEQEIAVDLVRNDDAAGSELGKARELIAPKDSAARVLRIAEIKHARLRRPAAAQPIEIKHPAAVLEHERNFAVSARRELERPLEVLVKRRGQQRVLIGSQ